MRPISNPRFNAFAAYCRSPQALAMGDEIAWFEAENSRIMATIIKDRIDGDYKRTDMRAELRKDKEKQSDEKSYLSIL